MRWTDTLTVLGCGRANVNMHVNSDWVAMQIARREFIHTPDGSGVSGEYWRNRDVNVETRRFTVFTECVDTLAALVDDESTVNELATQARYELMAAVWP